MIWNTMMLMRHNCNSDKMGQHRPIVFPFPMHFRHPIVALILNNGINICHLEI